MIEFATIDGCYWWIMFCCKIDVKAHHFRKIDSIPIQAYFQREIENAMSVAKMKPI